MAHGTREVGSYIRVVRAETQRYAKDLLGEYEKVLSLALSLSTEKARLQEQVSILREELRFRSDAYTSLLGQITEIESSDRTFGARYAELERMSSSLASLYVASYRIHSSLEREDVLAAIREVVITLIGSEEFAIFERERPGARLYMTDSFGLEAGRNLHAEAVEDMTANGKIYVRPLLRTQPNDGPIVCIPLKVRERVVGVIALYRLLSHKDRFEDLDHELCNLLSTHAGIALYSSSLYARSLEEETG